MSDPNVALNKGDESKPTTRPYHTDELRLLLLDTLDALLRRNREIETLLSDFRATLNAAVERDWALRIQTKDSNNALQTMLRNLQDHLLLDNNQIQKVIYDFWTQLASEPEQPATKSQPLAKGVDQEFTPKKYTKKHIRYQQLIAQIRELVSAILPSAAVVLVVSKGDEELLKLGHCIGWHFPQNENGLYAGHHLRDSEAAVNHLEALRARGGNFFLLPNTAFWWLDYYETCFHHLDHHYPRIWSDESCIIYQLQDVPNHHFSEMNGREFSRS